MILLKREAKGKPKGNHPCWGGGLIPMRQTQVLNPLKGFDWLRKKAPGRILASVVLQNLAADLVSFCLVVLQNGKPDPRNLGMRFARNIGKQDAGDPNPRFDRKRSRIKSPCGKKPNLCLHLLQSLGKKKKKNYFRQGHIPFETNRGK